MFDQAKLVALAIAAAILAGGGFATGWAVNGWRLGGELERTRSERDLAISTGKQLAEATKACSAGVERVSKLSDDAIGNMRRMLEESRRLHGAAQGQVQRLEDLLKQPTPTGADCNRAWDQIEKAGAP